MVRMDRDDVHWSSPFLMQQPAHLGSCRWLISLHLRLLFGISHQYNAAGCLLTMFASQNVSVTLIFIICWKKLIVLFSMSTANNFMAWLVLLGTEKMEVTFTLMHMYCKYERPDIWWSQLCCYKYWLKWFQFQFYYLIYLIHLKMDFGGLSIII